MVHPIPGRAGLLFNGNLFLISAMATTVGIQSFFRQCALYGLREHDPKKCPEKEDIGKRWYCYWSATKSIALLVMATDFAGSFSIPVMARMQSMFSTTTSASWWIAWKR